MNIYKYKRCVRPIFIHIKDIIIQQVDEIKYLGIDFDRTLKYSIYFARIKMEITAAFNLLRYLSKIKLSLNCNTLSTIYKALILSKINYGVVTYCSSAKSYLKLLDPFLVYYLLLEYILYMLHQTYFHWI